MKALRILPLLLFMSCVTPKVEFANFRTLKPQQVIDSISNSNGTSLYDFSQWDKNFFVGSDSVITTQYIRYQKVNKRTLIIIVSVKQNDSIYQIKYRKE